MTTNDQTIEAQIQAKGKTAPRITPADIEANIASEHYFTAEDGVGRASRGHTSVGGKNPYALSLLTFCVLVLRNGFTVTGESACASPENFDAEIGRNIARQNAVAKVWPLMGYELRSKLAGVRNEPHPYGTAVRPALLDAGMAPALKLKLAICAAFIALCLSFGTGWWLRGLQVKAATVDQTKAQAKADVQQAQRTSTAVQQHAQTKTETEIRYVTVTREVEKLVERPVYLERCMDDDGLRILNAQILGTNPPGPGPALPEAGHPAGHNRR